MAGVDFSKAEDLHKVATGYARAQKNTTSLKDGAQQLRSAQALSIDSIAPTKGSQIDDLLDLGQHTVWSKYAAPTHFDQYVGRTFRSGCLSTSVGDINKVEHQIEKLTKFIDSLSDDDPMKKLAEAILKMLEKMMEMLKNMLEVQSESGKLKQA